MMMEKIMWSRDQAVQSGPLGGCLEGVAARHSLPEIFGALKFTSI